MKSLKSKLKIFPTEIFFTVSDQNFLIPGCDEKCYNVLYNR